MGHSRWASVTTLLRVAALSVLPKQLSTALDGVDHAPEKVQAQAATIAEALEIDAVSVLVVEHSVPTAMPFGTQSNTTLVLTSSLIELLDHDALKAAMAHELAHISESDTKRLVLLSIPLLVLVVLLNRVSTALGLLGVGGSLLGVLAWSRSAELRADRIAIAQIEDPEALTRAIYAVRTGDPARSPHDEEPGYVRLLSPYPPISDR